MEASFSYVSSSTATSLLRPSFSCCPRLTSTLSPLQRSFKLCTSKKLVRFSLNAATDSSVPGKHDFHKVGDFMTRKGDLIVAKTTTTVNEGLPVVDEKGKVGSIERSYLMIKPDGVQRGLVGEIISRFERKGFTIKGLKLFSCPKELAEEHYKDLSSKPFFPKLVKYITSGPVVCLALEGPGVVASARKLIGATNPLQAEPGTIRGDLGIETGRNVIHGSDSPENGEREIGLWFKQGELYEWELTLTPWLRE